MSLRFNLALPLLAVLMPALVQAHPCWVRDVLVGLPDSPDTVRIQFDSLAPVQLISVARGHDRYLVEEGRVKEADGMRVTDIGDTLAVRDGDILHLWSGHHDSCTIRAVVQTGRKGVDLNALTQLPGLPDAMNGSFVPAH